jgi:cytochrome c oxidase subunit IV
MSSTHSSPTYRAYWGAWLVLLGLTLAMVYAGATPVLIGGILAKAGIITLLYMHLWHEHRRLFWTVLLGIFLTSAVLVALMVPDARAM